MPTSTKRPRIQIVTIEQILAGERPNLPMGRIDALKSAEAVEDEEKQQQLML